MVEIEHGGLGTIYYDPISAVVANPAKKQSEGVRF